MFINDLTLEHPGAKKVVLATTGLVVLGIIADQVLTGQVDIPLQPTSTDPVSILLWLMGLLVLAIATVFGLSWKFVTGNIKTNQEDIKARQEDILKKLDQIENEIIRNSK